VEEFFQSGPIPVLQDRREALRLLTNRRAVIVFGPLKDAGRRQDYEKNPFSQT
jgi:hypothetical protein